ncbi:lycopene cyclase domain-containing protein [Salinigranum halophilum]|uniref:lycopene cyclase domain-containing protein n=1 Tax=Salinigranum halophilum TaxID=2565931 RepID=UPI0010A94CFA|nr:lycopene cyclase domain-containing protein [Salinigranum halophilum]
MRLTYLGFHLVFILPPLALLLRAAPSLPPARRRVALTGLGAITFLALVYTTPWDNYLIDQGVWWYGEGTVVAYLGSAPVEEYLFFVLQPVLSGLFLYTMGFSPAFEQRDTRLRPRLTGGVGFLALSALGGVLLTTTSGYYLGAILLWACPLLALQWAVGGGYLVRMRREWPVAVAIPTLYLWFADRVAIGLGVWTISGTQTLGVDILGLPLEEAAFFLVTNLLVVQGLVLFEWVMHRWGRLTLDTDRMDTGTVTETEQDPVTPRVSPPNSSPDPTARECPSTDRGR